MLPGNRFACRLAEVAGSVSTVPCGIINRRVKLAQTSLRRSAALFLYTHIILAAKFSSLETDLNGHSTRAMALISIVV